MTMRSLVPAITLAAVLGLLVPATAEPAAPTKLGDPYALTTDAATAEPLGDHPVTVVHESRELRFANEANATMFRENPAEYLAKLDARMAEDQRPWYPLDRCVVSGEAIGGMGEPVEMIYRNRLIRLCCDDCKESVAKDPAGALAKLDEATIAAQRADYPLKACPVSGLALGAMGEPHAVVIASRLVQLCCAGCDGELRKDAPSVIAKIDAARGKPAVPASPAPEAPETPKAHDSHSHGHGM